MKVKERDELFIALKKFFDDGGLISRLDERTLNFGRDLGEIKSHLTQLNGSMAEQGKQVVSNKTSIRWIIRILGAAGVLGGSAVGLINWLG